MSHSSIPAVLSHWLGPTYREMWLWDTHAGGIPEFGRWGLPAKYLPCGLCSLAKTWVERLLGYLRLKISLKCFYYFFNWGGIHITYNYQVQVFNLRVFNVFTIICNDLFYLVPKHFWHPRRRPCTHCAILLISFSPRPWLTLRYFLSLWTSLLWIFHINRII